MEQHIENGIPLNTLPKTFQDAVFICRRLNISYLWIDSLCIIQDDPSDWFDQASRMEDVYKYSFVTIAATKARDPTQGCFSKTDASYQGERLLDFPNIIIRRLFITARWTSIRNIDEKNSPLYQRAWTYQELILPPRIIHFGMQEVTWNCETDGHKCQSKLKEGEGLFGTYNRLRSLTAEASVARWHDIITEYSARKLTFQKDRLPAIAAIAKKMQDVRSGDQYLAGLWRSTLLYDLLWCTSIYDYSSHRDRKNRTLDANIPSWSWASMSGCVRWFESVELLPFHCVELLETVYTTDGPTVSGPILEASIKLKAPLIKLGPDSGRRLTYRGWERTWGGEVRLESNFKLKATALWWDEVWWNEFDEKDTIHSTSWSEWEYDEGPDFNQYGRDVFLIPFLKETLSDTLGYGHRALMVESTDKANKYRRIGIAGIKGSGLYAFSKLGQQDDLDDVDRRISPQTKIKYWEHVIQEIEGMETFTFNLI